MYDKFVGLVNNLGRVEGSYGEAMKKLSEGRGNLIRKAEDMKKLRISNNKSLPVELVERSVLLALLLLMVRITFNQFILLKVNTMIANSIISKVHCIIDK